MWEDCGASKNHEQPTNYVVESYEAYTAVSETSIGNVYIVRVSNIFVQNFGHICRQSGKFIYKWREEAGLRKVQRIFGNGTSLFPYHRWEAHLCDAQYTIMCDCHIYY